MIDNRLNFKTMPATIILNKFIKNEPQSNYELFLIEYLNKSDFFQKKSSYNHYEQPETESDSELDAISDTYSIDFKLLASPSYLRGLRLTSNSVSTLNNGLTAYGLPRNEGKSEKVSEIHTLLRPLNLNMLFEIRNSTIKYEPLSDEYEIIKVLNTIETQKNILLLFPKVFSFDVEIKISLISTIIGEALENDFKVLAKYRSLVVNSFESYILTKFEDAFLLFQFSPNGFTHIETFDANNLVIYKKLKEYANPFN